MQTSSAHQLLAGLAGDGADEVRDHRLSVRLRHIIEADDLRVGGLPVRLRGGPDGHLELHSESSQLLVDQLQLVSHGVVLAGRPHDVRVVDDQDVGLDALEQKFLDVISQRRD